MLRCSNDFAPDLFPINAIVQLLIHKPNYCDIVTSDQVQAMANLRTGLWVIGRSDNSLDGIVQNDVGDLVTGQQCANQRSPIDCNDENLLWEFKLAWGAYKGGTRTVNIGLQRHFRGRTGCCVRKE